MTPATSRPGLRALSVMLAHLKLGASLPWLAREVDHSPQWMRAFTKLAGRFIAAAERDTIGKS